MKELISTLEKEQFSIKSIDQNDVSSLFQFLERNRDRLGICTFSLEYLYTEEISKEFLELLENYRANGTADLWGLWKQNDLIGVSYIFNCNTTHKRASIAILVDREHSRKGLGFKLATNTIDFCFNVSGIHRLEVRCLENDNICKAFAKILGFQMEGEFKDSAWINGKSRDEVQYSLLATDWNKSQEILH